MTPLPDESITKIRKPESAGSGIRFPSTLRLRLYRGWQVQGERRRAGQPNLWVGIHGVTSLLITHSHFPWSVGRSDSGHSGHARGGLEVGKF